MVWCIFRHYGCSVAKSLKNDNLVLVSEQGSNRW